MAPESFADEAGLKGFFIVIYLVDVFLGFSGKSCDIWALGATVYSFAYLMPPFLGETDDLLDLIEAIINNELFLIG